MASIHSTTGSRGVRISGSNAGHTMFRGSVKWYWLPTPFASFPFTSPSVRHRVPSHFNWTLPANSVSRLQALHRLHQDVTLGFGRDVNEIFWDVTRRWLVVSYRRFGTTYRILSKFLAVLWCPLNGIYASKKRSASPLHIFTKLKITHSRLCTLPVPI